jgi:hypothetical protein
MHKRQRPEPGNLCLDHIAHFVPDLDAAGAFLSKLGFVVTPPSAQQTQDGPAGTSNRCVMLAQGYLEFLTPTHDTPVANRMREYMAKHVGMHLACFGTPSAEAEHARLAAHGFEPLPTVNLSRKVESGETVRFSVVRVPPERMPEGRIQFVEHLAEDVIWRPEHLDHRNGVEALAAACVVADDPVDVAARYAEFAALLPRPDGDVIRLDTDRGAVLVATRGTWVSMLGAAPAAPSLAGYMLKCRNAAVFAGSCEAAGCKVRDTATGFAVLLPPVLGGAWLLENA